MGRRAKAILIHERDNVATALETLEAGTTVTLEVAGRAEGVTLPSAIPAGHKFALRQIEAGAFVIKYGEPIGKAAARILPGEHVHVHNVESKVKKQAGASV
jgi:altronate dehydratase small subunit